MAVYSIQQLLCYAQFVVCVLLVQIDCYELIDMHK